MKKLQIVIDTNVFISALRSRRGASYKLFLLLDSPKFKVNISVPLILEYEAVAKRIIDQTALNQSDIDDIIDYICGIANHLKIFYLWRPFLKDANDDMVLELAVAANCDVIVTYNKDDFDGVEQFNVLLMTAKEFLE